ncbi:MAG: class III poly(R)-hydroxyalkanoic acid synthase subunit PhaC [Proteobacteria bacterium]|nr:class III poly(R)-hydroxyalkanoic acid synthase subunit PhaC [Pseudomonadota bacterium]
MIPFQMRPDEIIQEISDFNGKLAQGLNTLSEIGELEDGISPKDAVYKEDKMVLYHYKPRVEKLNPIPLLIVYALVNRPYMADLQEGRSMIQGLLDAGVDVYLVDWGYPDAGDAYLTLEDYINGYIDRCVDVIRDEHGLDKINILGICQGGSFSLCYAALHQEKIKNIITTVTPVDFHTKNDLLSKMVRHVDVDLLVDTEGNISGDDMNSTYLSMKPFQLMGQKYVDLVNILDDTEKLRNFMRMEKWIFDSPDQVGETIRQFTKQFYQENGLVKGTVKIGDDTVDLGNITVPVLNIYARDDHLVPPDSSKALGGCVSSKDYTELEFPGGHIGVFVSGKAQAMIPPAVGKWLDERT